MSIRMGIKNMIAGSGGGNRGAEMPFFVYELVNSR
ncbi:MAG: hypothetical protein ACJAYP_001375 [Flavobacterium sp.]|jgi:hypothetical protein